MSTRWLRHVSGETCRVRVTANLESAGKPPGASSRLREPGLDIPKGLVGLKSNDAVTRQQMCLVNPQARGRMVGLHGDLDGTLRERALHVRVVAWTVVAAIVLG